MLTTGPIYIKITRADMQALPHPPRLQLGGRPVKPRPCPTCHSTRTCASVQIPTIWQCLNRSCEVAFFDAQGVMATADALSRLRQTPPPTAEETHA